MMEIKLILACLVVKASALCPIGYKHGEIDNKCYKTCPDCPDIKTRRQITNIVNPSRADLSLIADKLKYAVKSFVNSEGMIDTYLCPSAWTYDFSKKRCMPPPKRRYMDLQPVDCPFCHLKEDKKKRKPKEVSEFVDVFEIPLYEARSKKRNSLAKIIDEVMKLYQ